MSEEISDSEQSPHEHMDEEEDAPFTLPKKKSRVMKLTNSTATPTANRYKILSDMSEENQRNTEDNSKTKKQKFFPPTVLHMENLRERRLEFAREHIEKGARWWEHVLFTN